MNIINKSFTRDRYEITMEVLERHHGLRLDSFIQECFPSWSRESIKKKIHEAHVKIEGRPFPHRPSVKVHFGEKIILEIIKDTHEDEYWNGEKLILQEIPDIIYQDENLVVISKPPFMATHPTGRHLFNCATVYLEQLLNIPIHSIHRIDRETSGILLFGKNPNTSATIGQYFETSVVKKAYFFIAKKNSPKVKEGAEFEARERLESGDKGKKRIYINHFSEKSENGKSAFTRFKIFRVVGDYCIGLAFPRTGRQHQIRVHAMIHGFPLIGDKLYLGSYKLFQNFKDHLATKEDFEFMELPRHALHALAINLPYKNGITFWGTFPKDLKDFMEEKLNLDSKVMFNEFKEEITKRFK